MKIITIILSCLMLASSLGTAEMRRFQNKDRTKSFFAELTGYEQKTKRVTVRLKNGRKNTFLIDVLSPEDQKYVIENGPRLALGNDIRVSMRKFHGKSTKKTKGRTTDRIAPSGYNITLSNRARNTYKGLTINYTIYYGVQGYIEPKRKTETATGTLKCDVISPQETINLTTETVDIVSGKLEPVIEYRNRRTRDGDDYLEPIVKEPGGRRKDILMGCKVEILLDGEVVKSETHGTIGLTNPDKE